MMTTNEMIEAFNEAYREGYVTGDDAVACDSNCDTCPASKVCEQLSNKGDFTLFTVNYNNLIKGKVDFK